MSLLSRRSSKLKWPLVFLAWAVGLGATETVYAGPLYGARITCIGQLGCTPGEGASVVDSPSPVSLSRLITVDVSGNGTRTSQNIASAGSGILQGLSRATTTGAGAVAQEDSTFTLDNLIIIGPPGSILVSFNVAISGSIGATATPTGGAFVSAAHVDVEGAIGSSVGAFGFDLGSMDVSDNDRSPLLRTGIFSSFPVNSDGTVLGITPFITTFAGDPSFRLSLTLRTAAIATEVFGEGQGLADGFALFNNTFGFPTSGPVANLPEGYTLNSSDGCIVDNRFVCGANGANPAPEPSTWLLLGPGLTLLMTGRSRFGRALARRIAVRDRIPKE